MSGKQLVEKVAKQNSALKIDVIFSSPLMRTMQTANIMNKYHNVPILKDERLTEIDQGIFAGRRKDSLSDLEREQKQKRLKECGMENFDQLEKRIKDFAKFLKNSKYENVLIVIHSSPARILSMFLVGEEFNPENDNSRFYFKNAEIKELDL